MGTIQAKRFKEALQKVRKVGRLEEAMTISDTEIVIQNLSLDEYTDALRACEGLNELDYANAFQMEQVSRSIVEIDGQDLRDGDFIEDEVPNGHWVIEFSVPNKPAADAVQAKLAELKIKPTVTRAEDGTVKTMRFERHQWLKDNLLQHWGREAVGVCWKKVTETFIKAEDNAKKGVSFMIPDETPEDKFRRSLNDLREAEADLPDELVLKLLGEAGFLKKTSQEELEGANARMAQVRAQEAPAPAPVQPAAPPPPARAPQQAPAPPPPPPPVQSFNTEDFTPPQAVQNMMASRQRLNNDGGPIPVPIPPPETVPVSASPRSKVPDAIRRAAYDATQSIKGGLQEEEQPPQQHYQAPQAMPSHDGGGITTRRGSRAEQIAALEGQLDEIPVLQREPEVNPQTLAVDRRPAIGRNPKFNPQPPRHK